MTLEELKEASKVGANDSDCGIVPWMEARKKVFGCLPLLLQIVEASLEREAAMKEYESVRNFDEMDHKREEAMLTRDNLRSLLEKL